MAGVGRGRGMGGPARPGDFPCWAVAWLVAAAGGQWRTGRKLQVRVHAASNGQKLGGGALHQLEGSGAWAAGSGHR